MIRLMMRHISVLEHGNEVLLHDNRGQLRGDVIQRDLTPHRLLTLIMVRMMDGSRIQISVPRLSRKGPGSLSFGHLNHSLFNP
jgi:hypothetical protein